MRERIARMLDVVALVKAVRDGMRGVDRGSALLVFVLAGLGSLVTGTITWVVDWLPTWRFANGELPSGASTYTAYSIGETAIQSAGAMADWVGGLGNITLGGFIGGCIAVGFTLLPTIVQMIAPRVVHPVASVIMDVSIGFDFITDWPSAALQAEGLVQNPIGRFILTIGLVLLYSLVVQSIFVLFLTAFICATIILLAGDGGSRRSGAAQTIEA